jgi:hypothetical protein
MLPDLLSTLIGICLVCSTVLEPGLLEAHGWIVALSGAALAALGFWAHRVDYLKWPGATVVAAGLAIVLLVVSGVAARSPETAFWVIFWSANSAGLVALWSALYRGPKLTPSEPA